MLQLLFVSFVNVTSELDQSILFANLQRFLFIVNCRLVIGNIMMAARWLRFVIVCDSSNVTILTLDTKIKTIQGSEGNTRFNVSFDEIACDFIDGYIARETHHA